MVGLPLVEGILLVDLAVAGARVDNLKSADFVSAVVLALISVRNGSTNPGNNLHVSSLSHKVDTRDLEQAFAKIGRVSKLPFVVCCIWC